ncbi:Acyltransferase 3 [Bradyrhizobium sp. ORS 375]|uniref:OpgC domain-containing protein n=1 Tax=Bradyrhizobium sp. (strain ORS 375) TaxID=566679 RepID=UPI00024095FE|nr:OpgC domain-containing protein [Bradyrhizobium sp. ORS 375]CCD91591.1 Acyltransferase 3 [Bradyrhizobium sp. ORS 375]
METKRDLRLDFFRGLALWLIFLDHIPSNFVNSFTIRNFGFSDATEIFVFISGYTAAYVYGAAMSQQGFLVAGARILRRTWQIYVAHVFLFCVYLAQIAYVARSFRNTLYSEEMGVFEFLRDPDVTLIEALLLRFKPANMDVLPLYIALLAGFAPLLWLLLRRPTLALLGSIAIYGVTRMLDLNIPAYPSGHWVFNPFAWQLLFSFGAWCALGGADQLRGLLLSRAVLAASVAYLSVSLAIVVTWHVPAWTVFVPRWLAEWMYPIDKTSLDPLRILHFLALTVLVVRLLPREWPYLRSSCLRPLVLCGQHSLEIFCFGVFLSFAAHFMIIETHGGIVLQLFVSFAGMLLMTMAAAVMNWFKHIDGRGRAVQSTRAGPARSSS